MERKKKIINKEIIKVCHCGCELPVGKKALFVTGHDGKLRSIIVKHIKTGKPEIPKIAKEILHTFYKGKYRNLA